MLRRRDRLSIVSLIDALWHIGHDHRCAKVVPPERTDQKEDR
jgi:hypothetical protein